MRAPGDMNPAAPPDLGGLEGLLEDFDDDAFDFDVVSASDGDDESD